jgi:hypothetical protein
VDFRPIQADGLDWDRRIEDPQIVTCERRRRVWIWIWVRRRGQIAIAIVIRVIRERLVLIISRRTPGIFVRQRLVAIRRRQIDLVLIGQTRVLIARRQFNVFFFRISLVLRISPIHLPNLESLFFGVNRRIILSRGLEHLDE